MPFNFTTTSTFPDVEDLMCDLLDQAVEGVTPQIHVGSWIPDSSGQLLDSGEAVIIANRMGGFSDYTDRAAVDNAVVCLSILGRNRQDAWQVANHIRQFMYENCSGTVISGWRINRIEENEGPSEVLYSDPLERMVRLYFNVGFVRHKR